MKYLFLFYIMLLTYFPIQAQSITFPIDSSLRTQAISFTTDQYFQFIQRQALLYSGSEYVEFESAFNGHQYLYSKLWEEADISFDDLLYQQIDARYDLYRDLLIIKHFDESGRMVSIIPDQQLISGFNIHGEDYLRIESLNFLQNTPQITGYLHVIYTGKITILSKKIKNINNSSTTDVTKEFIEKHRFYLIRDNEIHQIKGTSSLWKLLPDHKKELKRFARRNGLFFSREKAFYLVQIIKKYESLTNIQ